MPPDLFGGLPEVVPAPKRKRAAPLTPKPESFPVGSPTSPAAPAVKLVDTADSKSVTSVGSNPTGGTIDTSDIPEVTDPAFYEKATWRNLEGLRYGICRGGFYDGKNLAHHGDLFWVAWRHGAEEKGPITYAGPETEEIYYTRYQWDPAKREWNDVR